MEAKYVKDERICERCGKANVCKYADELKKKVSEFESEIGNVCVPISVSINCYEWVSNKVTR